MRIACIGGGPAGLYLGISMKVRDPSHEVVLHERNRLGDTFGWGVVFSDQTVENLMANDPESGRIIAASFNHWDDIAVQIRGETVRTSGHGFIGIGRKRLLEILHTRAAELGVVMHYESERGPELEDGGEFDLIVAADGVNSRIRDRHSDEFGVDIDVRANKFVWLGTSQTFDAFTFAFEETAQGWVWAHAYQFAPGLSTFIVECSESTWRALGLDAMTQEETCRWGERVFARHLGNHPLMSNASHLVGSAAWLNFRRVLCERWTHGNVVLLGDAAHTAHFSIGSGTKLALEDAIKLAEVLNRPGLTRGDALQEYQAERTVEVLKLQNSARNSTEWFETLDRYLGFEPDQFAYSLMTRSQRVSHENLRLRDRPWLENIERWFAARAGAPHEEPVAPMFAPYQLGDMRLPNRVAVAPMAIYMAQDGMPGDYHLVHYGARAQGGAGLLFTEMIAVSPEGRPTPGCPGLYTEDQETAWRRIVDFVHGHTDAKVCAQIGHAGPRGATRPGWEGMDVPLQDGGWPLLGASERPWGPRSATPRPLTEADMADVIEAFRHATRRALAAGFDMVELNAAHGYLLSAFITPLQNVRDDAFGGSLDNRLRFPLRVFRAVREEWPKERPISVRISATDWVGENGIAPADGVAIGRAFSAAGADLIDVSSGETSRDARPVFGRMFQTPLADRIRNEAGVPTMTAGNIYEADHVNSILVAGRADIVALGRPHLVDPMWTLRQAAAQDSHPVRVPPPYLPGKEQLARNLRRDAEALRA